MLDRNKLERFGPSKPLQFSGKPTSLQQLNEHRLVSGLLYLLASIRQG